MISRLLSSYLWSPLSRYRRTRAVSKAQDRLKRASGRRNTQEQHAAMRGLQQARIDGLRREVGHKRVNRATVLFWSAR